MGAQTRPDEQQTAGKTLPRAVRLALLFTLLADPTPPGNAGAEASVAKPRLSLTLGVPPDLQQRYNAQTSETFSCLDGKRTLAWSAVNDDYCDCEDGSDEPGTSACMQGTFYCPNAGHFPGVIRSSRVNDGVCEPECCDGSDEYGGRVSCSNTCAAAAEEYSRKQQEIIDKQRAGYAFKKKYSTKGQKLKAERRVEIDKLKAELEEAKINVEQAEVAKDQAEKDEQARKDQQESSRSKSKERLRICVEHLRHAVERVNAQREHILTLLELLSTMKRDHNQNYHDMAVKKAIQGYDEFVEQNSEFSEKAEGSVDEDLSTALEDLEDMQENGEVGKSENLSPSSRSEELESSGFSSWVSGVLKELQVIVVRHFRPFMNYFTGTVAVSSLRDPSSASSIHTSALDKQRDIERKIADLEKKLGTDYGKDEEWAAVDGECVEHSSGEYAYEVCFFGTATQKGKDGVPVSIGNFASWASGLDKSDPAYYRTMEFKNGAKCWNGPERSITLSIECGAQNELFDVMEPEKCEYTGRLLTPAACEPLEEGSRPISDKKPADPAEGGAANAIHHQEL